MDTRSTYYDNATKKYVPGTKFEDILKLYQFDQELSALIFSMISKIEIALRVRLVEALITDTWRCFNLTGFINFFGLKKCTGRICPQ